MKRLGILFFAVLFCADIKAQVPVMVGFRTGATLSKLEVQDDPLEDYAKWNAGALAGLLVNIGIYKQYVSLQPEVTFLQKGITYTEYPSGTNTITQKISTNYVSSSLMAFGGFGGNVRMRVGIGPYFAVWNSGFPGTIKTKLVEEDGRVTQNDRVIIDLKRGGDVYDNRREFGLAFGAGTTILPKGGKNGLIVDFRYDMGLTDTKYYPEGMPTTAPQRRNNTMSLSVGYVYKVQ